MITFIPRLLLVSYVVKQIHNRKAGFKTLIVGGSDKAVDLFKEVNELPKGSGHQFVGFININGIDKLLKDHMPYLGHIDDVETVLRENEIEEVIIALESIEHDRLKKIISRLKGYHGSTYLSASVSGMNFVSLWARDTLSNSFLIDVNSALSDFKKDLLIFDIVASIIALVLLTPLFILLGVLVKLSSPGPILFKQNRIGKKGRLFKIIKFRTMLINSEKNGPQLSSSNDPRITNIGRFMRKSRLDEFLQFYNVLIGDMSIVGPRPERQFFINQIIEREPQFLELTKVRPGITSWGQVKYGYAENVDQMLDRMKYDLLYLKNRSISLDFKIMLYTVIIIFKGVGK